MVWRLIELDGSENVEDLGRKTVVTRVALTPLETLAFSELEHGIYVTLGLGRVRKD